MPKTRKTQTSLLENILSYSERKLGLATADVREFGTDLFCVLRNDGVKQLHMRIGSWNGGQLSFTREPGKDFESSEILKDSYRSVYSLVERTFTPISMENRLFGPSVSPANWQAIAERVRPKRPERPKVEKPSEGKQGSSDLLPPYKHDPVVMQGTFEECVKAYCVLNGREQGAYTIWKLADGILYVVEKDALELFVDKALWHCSEELYNPVILRGTNIGILDVKTNTNHNLIRRVYGRLLTPTDPDKWRWFDTPQRIEN